MIEYFFISHSYVSYLLKVLGRSKIFLNYLRMYGSSQHLRTIKLYINISF